MEKEKNRSTAVRRPDCVTETRMGNTVLVVSGFFKDLSFQYTGFAFLDSFLLPELSFPPPQENKNNNTIKIGVNFFIMILIVLIECRDAPWHVSTIINCQLSIANYFFVAASYPALTALMLRSTTSWPFLPKICVMASSTLLSSMPR